MRRRVIQRRVVVFLLLLLVGGAIVNVGVAWGCAVWTPLWLDGGTPLDSQQIDWLVYKTHDTSMMNADLEVVARITGIGFATDEIAVIGWRNNDGGKGFESVAVITRCGWPLKTTIGGEVISSGLVKSRRLIDAIELSRATPYGFVNRHVSYSPIWPGFAINTIFYAAILWVVFFVPGKLKRTLRRRRGLCPACAYPVGTSPVCTECGGPVTLVPKD